MKANQASKSSDVVLCIGIIIKGETFHFETMCHTITNSLMDIQIKNNIPVINHVLQCYNIEQVKQRINSESIIDTVRFALK